MECQEWRHRPPSEEKGEGKREEGRPLFLDLNREPRHRRTACCNGAGAFHHVYRGVLKISLSPSTAMLREVLAEVREPNLD